MAATFRPRESKHVKSRIPPKPGPKYPILGDDILRPLYGCAGILGRSGSGKTSLAYDLLHSRCGPRTTVLLFSASAFLDDNMIFITNWLKKNHIKHAVHTSFIDKDGNNILEAFMNMFDEQHEKDKHMKEGGDGLLSYSDKPTPIGGAFLAKASKEKKFYKTLDPYLVEVDGEVKEYQPYIFLVDDMKKEELRHVPNFEDFVKRRRHYRSQIIISSQDYKDFPVSVRNLVQDWFLYGDIHPKRLTELYDYVPPTVTEEQFMEIYREATKQRHSYLHIDVTNKTMSRDDEEDLTLAPQ